MPPKRGKKGGAKPIRAKKRTSKASTSKTPLPSTPTPKITLKLNTISAVSATARSSSDVIPVTTTVPVASTVTTAPPAPPAPENQPESPPPLPESASQIEEWLVELEIRLYIDGVRFGSRLKEISNRDDSVGYDYIKQLAQDARETEIKRSYGGNQARRDHDLWYASYGKVGNPTDTEIRDSDDFDTIIRRIRRRTFKNKQLILQICFSIKETPQTMVRP